MKEKITIFSLFICIALLLACQQGRSNYKDFLNSWVGRSEADLVSTWGAPEQINTLSQNRQEFIYIKSREIDLNQQDQVLFSQNSIFDEDNSLEPILTYYCQTTFTTQDDIIVSYAFDGAGCELDK